MSDVEGMVRREVMQVLVDAAGADKVSLHADAIAIVSQPELFVASVPIGGVEDIDFKSMLDGRSYLDGTPVMYWYLASASLRDKAVRLDEGFYTVVADQQNSIVSLRNVNSETVAQGDLRVSFEPQAPTTAEAKRSISGKITDADAGLFPPRLKVCGEVTVKKDGVTVKVSGCISVGF